MSPAVNKVNVVMLHSVTSVICKWRSRIIYKVQFNSQTGFVFRIAFPAVWQFVDHIFMLQLLHSVLASTLTCRNDACSWCVTFVLVIMTCTAIFLVSRDIAVVACSVGLCLSGNRPSHIHCSIPGSKLTSSTNLFHHSLLAPTWTAFSDYTGSDLLCSTVFHF